MDKGVNGILFTRDEVQQIADEYDTLFPANKVNSFKEILNLGNEIEENGGLAVYLFDKDKQTLYALDEANISRIEYL